MKFVLVLLAVVCATQALNLRECVDTVLDTVERSAGKVDGYREWRARVDSAFDDYFTQREGCAQIPNPIQGVECHARNVRSLYQSIDQLAEELNALVGGGVNIGADLVQGIRRCFG